MSEYTRRHSPRSQKLEPVRGFYNIFQDEQQPAIERERDAAATKPRHTRWRGEDGQEDMSTVSTIKWTNLFPSRIPQQYPHNTTFYKTIHMKPQPVARLPSLKKKSILKESTENRPEHCSHFERLFVEVPFWKMFAIFVEIRHFLKAIRR